MEYLCLQPDLSSFTVLSDMYPWILHGTALTCHKISGRFIHVPLSIFLPRRFLCKQRVRPDRGVSLCAKVKAKSPLKSPLCIGSLDNVEKKMLLALTWPATLNRAGNPV